jgi:curved DNA-binding protein CbpA
MKHYQVLNLPFTSSSQEIKKRYHELVLQYHPDKNKETNMQFFHEIQEAYEILSNEEKRREYDSECNLNRFEPRDYIFTEEDYQLIFDYAKRIQSSIEYRFFMSLLCKIPRGTKEDINQKVYQKFTSFDTRFQTNEFFKRMKGKRILNMKTIKTINIQELFEDITIHLQIALEKVYNGFCDEIMVIGREKIFRIYVTKTNYSVSLSTDQSRIVLHFCTNDKNYKIINDTLIYTYVMNLYEYYYEDSFIIKLPNQTEYSIHRERDEYDNVGLIRKKCKEDSRRHKLYIQYILKHNKPKDEYKELLKKMFQG